MWDTLSKKSTEKKTNSILSVQWTGTASFGDLPDGSFDMQDFLSIQRVINIWRMGWTLQKHNQKEEKFY